MEQKLKDEVYEIMIRSPAKSDYELAEELNVSRAFVWKLRKKFIGKLDYALAQKLAGAFLADFQQASEYFKLQIKDLDKKKVELAKLKGMKKTIFKKNEAGGLYPVETDLGVFDLMAITKMELEIDKQQSELWKNIMLLARQGEAVEVMKMVQHGRIQLTA